MSKKSRSVLLSLVALVLVCCGGGDDVVREPVEASAGSGAPPPAPPRRVLTDAEATTPGSMDLAGLALVDLRTAISNGQLTIDANDARVASSVDSLFDGDPETLAVSNQTNPLTLTITLDRPVRLAAVRVFLAGSSYDWVLEPLPATDRRLLQEVPERTWSQLDLAQPVETSVVRIEILRLERDDYVHVGEVELYQRPV